MSAKVMETPDYDPRYDRAQTIDGAKARYVEDGNGYTIHDYENDVERILEHGENPDKEPRHKEPLFEGQTVIS